MFQITSRILQDTESLLLNLPAQNKIWKWPTRYIIFPFKFLQLGLGDFIKPASLWAFLSVALILLTAIFVQKLNVPMEYRGTILNISLFIPMALVIFSVPSTYAFSGVIEKNITKVKGFLQKEGINTIEETELLEENIKRIFSRTNSRVSFYKWLVGALWTLYIVFFSIEMKVFLSAKPKTNDPDLSNTIMYFAIYLFSSLFAMFLIVGYKRASDILIKTIEYACTQNKYEFIKA